MLRHLCALTALFVVVPLTAVSSASAFDFWGPVIQAANEGPNEPGEIPDGWIPWDVPVAPINPCDLGIGCDGATIDPSDDPDMPGTPVYPGGWIVFMSYGDTPQGYDNAPEDC